MKWVICLKNEGYAASLESHKVYPVVEDIKAEALGLIRIVDESGESYLYGANMFSNIPLSRNLEEMLLAA
jgi:hypothetical protein